MKMKKMTLFKKAKNVDASKVALPAAGLLYILIFTSFY